jgi:hypothetical protein
LEVELGITVINKSVEAGNGGTVADGDDEGAKGVEGLTAEMLEKKVALEKCKVARLSQEVKVCVIF